MAVKVQDCHLLITYFAKQYREKYGDSPVINRWRARYGFESVLMDMPMDEAKGLIDFYLLTVSTNRHSLDWFFNNYDKIINNRNEHEIELKRREQQRRETQERTSRWRELRAKREAEN